MNKKDGTGEVQGVGGGAGGEWWGSESKGDGRGGRKVEMADLNHNLHELRSGIPSSFLADVRYNCGSRLTFKNTKKFEKL